VKYFFVYRTALRLTLPFITMVCLLLAGPVPAGATTKTRVEIGFVGTQPTNGSTGMPLSFQNVLLNIVSVRLNIHPGAAPTAGGWEKIPAPPGIGVKGTNAQLQIDLNSSQNIPQLFNTASVRTENYKIVQLVLNSTNPGSLIPTCPASPPADGCINYPLQINNPNGITFIDKSGLLNTSTGNLATLVMQVFVSINKIPSAPGGAYIATISIAPATTTQFMGNVTGQVNVTGTASTSKIRKLTVSAETIGTNTVIATAPIKGGTDCGTSSPGGCFDLALPAAGPPAPGTPFGSLYDLAISGGAATYAAERLPPLFPGQTITLDPKTTFNLMGNQTLGTITGTVSDGCVAGKKIVGATLQLLMPPNNSKDNSLCMSAATAGQCVSVATANTFDSTGTFPMPGSATVPAAFDSVPTLGKNSAGYAMEVTAPGYDPLFVQARPNSSTTKGGGTCSVDGGAFKKCDLSMMTGYIAGAFPIVTPNPGQTAQVQVFAEDHDTNNIESALPMAITIGSNPNVGSCSPPAGSVCAEYSLNVPPSIPIGAFDLFAQTIDHYQGLTDPYPGHSIVPISAVPAPSACATVTAPTPSESITCVGHGSITGTVAVPPGDLGTSVVLEKLDPDGAANDNEVQLTNSLVQNQPQPGNLNPSSNYGFCAPADTYQVQKVELVPTPEPTVVPTAAPSPSPVGDPVSVTIPLPPDAGGPGPSPTMGGPSPTATPMLKCPTNCSHPDGTCPGICNNAMGPQL
jgi:hypothetical protein